MKLRLNKFSRSLFFVISLFILNLNLAAQTKDFTKYVNPFIGTGGHGHTFPGATVPFGMVQLSPDTRIDNWDGSSGYHYSDSTIYGFSHTHLSGTGIPDYCDILFMPTVGKPEFTAKEGEKSENGYASKFSHANEKAEPGYYSVKLDDDGIFAEMTATERVGLHRYTFPKTDEANIILDLKWRDKVLDSELKIIGNNRIEGYRRSSSWAKDQVVYFVAEFSKPFNDYYYSSNSTTGKKSIIKATIPKFKGTEVKTYVQFKTSENEQILVKVGISPVSIEGARKNLAAEIPDWDFEKVRADAKAKWNKELSKIEVSGGTDEQTTNFYTALYHLNIQPNIFSDVDGNYLGLDRKIHNLNENQSPKSKVQRPKSENYTVFSLWDTFRAAHPLYTIIDERRTVDFINTFIRQYEQGGRLPVWELAGNETDTMIGYHAVSVIADAMAKGIKGFDYEKAFAAAKHSAELDHFGLAAYKKRGYISMEDENEGVSKTLEYAYNDYCVATMAQSLMRENLRMTKAKFDKLQRDADKYFKRSEYYKNLFDAETGFMRPRQNGGFVSPFKPNEVTFHFTEGNSWVYSFFVPHDVNGLIDLYGGKQKFAKKLDELFTTEDTLTGREQPDITGLIGQYAHGNEPSHHIAYLFNYANQPWKTQGYIRKILDEFYKPQPDGLIGNEDCGQMSAWYILSALGFYQVNPSRAVYDFGTPLFTEAKIKLENGKIVTIKAANVSAKNIYIKSVKFNGKAYRATQFQHRDLMNGATIEFEMTDAPVKDWFDEFSFSQVGGGLVAVPVINVQKRTFNDAANVSIKTIAPDAKILYSLDGSEPKIEYTKEFSVDKTSVVKAVSVNQKGIKSFVVEAKLTKIPHDWTVKILSKYNRQYTGGGDEGLIDGIRGTLNFASGEWQGYQDQDFVAIVDLKKETEIKRVGGGFLQDARPWIWMPTRVEFEVSNDGVNFSKVAEIKTDVAPEDMKPQIKDYFQSIAPTKARFVRVKAYNLGKIPAWHPGAGDDAFIFVDEIFID
ncbi:MAG TPA: GH92 family glycosyl hydrolase [Pyrinomonadaceae bacterium]|nr:GH92 family glycosyl hydrolase [Pyrinomonadaceae bacterium]